MPRVRATSRDFVLDVGSGGFPHSTADVLVDRFLDDFEHHRGDKELIRDRPMVCADIAQLPFADKTFDYVICNQVVEHLEDPAVALDELSRVGRRGFLSVPSEFHEFLCPIPVHRWVFAFKNGTLLFKRKGDSHDLGLQMYGGVFHMLYEQADFRRIVMRRPTLFLVNVEWENEIPYRVCEPETPFYDYHDPASVGHLLLPVPPDSPVDAFQRWFRIAFGLSTQFKAGKLRARVRQVLKERMRLAPAVR
jgi:SAM-dependent methyltransferase